ncbi:MAG: aminotransferase class IV, partial [Alphaproteobacteria bacterium]|nr:aminotransferase class IV [Alphaproteobacteria bacterium]
QAILEVSRANGIRATTHYRMIAFLDGDDELSTTGPTGIVAGAVVRGSTPRVEKGMAAMISSYTRIADNALPPRVKCTANYVNNRAAELEAKAGGYDGALMLTQEGKLSEASGACVFLVRNGRLVTPDLSSDILESITRDTVIELGRSTLGLAVEERRIDRSEIVAADEMFACGSGWEVVPITSVGRIDVGDGRPGPVTRAVQKAYFDAVHGRTNKHADWLTPVW